MINLLFKVHISYTKNKQTFKKEKAKRILQANRAKLDALAKFLYEKEAITGDEFMEILTSGGEEQ